MQAPFDIEAFLERNWPAVHARLGERRGAFLQLVQARAAERGFAEPAGAARFANLCFAFGSGFETRPENEWALATLLDERLGPWVKLHQLVHRGAAELGRRPDQGDALAAQLRQSDQRIVAAFELPQVAAPGQIVVRPADAMPLPQQACDIEALELRVLDAESLQEYGHSGGAWTRRPVPPPTPLRIDAHHAAPSMVTLLVPPAGAPAPVRLQLRQVQHGRCGLHLHPAVTWAGPRDTLKWTEHEAQQPAWPVLAPAQDEVPPLLASDAAEYATLRIGSCGLRDEGVPLSPPQGIGFNVRAHGACQLLWTMRRQALLGFELPDPKSAPPSVEPTKIAYERDGQSLDARRWVRGFDEDLPARLREGLQRLTEAWKLVVQQPRVRVDIGLFDGQAGLTWGWRQGAKGLAGDPFVRAVGLVDLGASVEGWLSGIVEHGGTKAAVRLRVKGDAHVKTELERVLAEPDLITAMAGAQLRWRWPITVEADPIADGDGTIISEVGPCTGAISGSLGLRPSVTVAGGWEWFASVTTEPVSARVVVHDPLLGRAESQLALLGSINLLDWSVA